MQESRLEMREHMQSLKHPVRFILTKPDALWPELRGRTDGRLAPEVLAKRCAGLENNWVIRTYLHLHEAGYQNVDIGVDFRADAINIPSATDFGIKKRMNDHFIVIPRADTAYPCMANFFIAQNDVVPPSRTHDNIQHWPQAGILVREHDKRNGVTQASFKGRTINLDPAFRSEAFVSSLAQLGVAYQQDSFDGVLGVHSWWDYRETDVVIAVRNLTIRDANNKPASKLINAWFGEAPAILGPEPAFRAIRQSDLDYIEVRSPNEALEAVRLLQNDADRYWAMIENGRRRRGAFTEEAITARWVALLNGRIAAAFEAWQARRSLSRAVSIGIGMVGHKAAKRYHRYYIRNGRRLLDG